METFDEFGLAMDNVPEAIRKHHRLSLNALIVQLKFFLRFAYEFFALQVPIFLCFCFFLCVFFCFFLCSNLV